MGQFFLSHLHTRDVRPVFLHAGLVIWRFLPELGLLVLHLLFSCEFFLKKVQPLLLSWNYLINTMYYYIDIIATHNILKM